MRPPLLDCQCTTLAWRCKITWTAGTDRTTGSLVTASQWNALLGATGSLMETAVAKATTSGRLFRSTGTNAIQEFVPAACRVYHNAAQSISAATPTVLAFNSERFDTEAMHDTSSNNSRITIVTAGVYVINANVVWNSNASVSFYVSLLLNGTTTIAYQGDTPAAGGVNNLVQQVSTIYKLAAADYVEVSVFQGTGGAVNVNSNGNFSPEFAAAWLSSG